MIDIEEVKRVLDRVYPSWDNTKVAEEICQLEHDEVMEAELAWRKGKETPDNPQFESKPCDHIFSFQTGLCQKCGKSLKGLLNEPKPDEGKVLTIDEIKANPAYNEYLKTMSYGGAQRACQRDLTASECQKRVERIFRELEEMYPWVKGKWGQERYLEWQALKKQQGVANG